MIISMTKNATFGAISFDKLYVVHTPKYLFVSSILIALSFYIYLCLLVLMSDLLIYGFVEIVIFVFVALHGNIFVGF